MRLIISGGCGFIASHVAELLLASGNHVLAIDNFSTGKMENVTHLMEKYPHNFNVQEGDICILPFLNRIFNDFKPKYVIHLAAQAAITTAWENPVKDITVNAVGTLNVIQASKLSGVEKIIFSSTSAVYRETNAKIKETSLTLPANPYGISKLAAENYLLCMFPATTILRFGNVYGERQTPIGENQVIPRMIKHFKYGDTFYINGDGKQERDFVYAGDVAQAVANALYNKPGIFNIASGTVFSVNEIAGIVEDFYGIQGYKWDHNDAQDPRRSVCLKISEAYDNLNWKPIVTIREGINKTIRWWENKNTPTLSSLRGIAPDITGGKLSEDFIRQHRDSDW
jgi:UDP-glucose 4-epimerase